MGKNIQLPTRIREMSAAEYAIVSGVCGDTLPYRFRIWITDAAGVDGRAFTIPTSLISTILEMPETGFFAGVAVGYVASIVNLAYLINVGTDYGTLATSAPEVLVHETTHVWQGKNSTFALSYVFNSVYNQCVVGHAHKYTAGAAWKSDNVEQQTSIEEDWYTSGHSTTSPLYHYITDNLRKGDA